MLSGYLSLYEVVKVFRLICEPCPKFLRKLAVSIFDQVRDRADLYWIKFNLWLFGHFRDARAYERIKARLEKFPFERQKELMMDAMVTLLGGILLDVAVDDQRKGGNRRPRSLIALWLRATSAGQKIWLARIERFALVWKQAQAERQIQERQRKTTEKVTQESVVSPPSQRMSNFKTPDWRRLSEAERKELEAKLTPLLDDEKAFTQALIDQGYPPPGTVVFGADGRVERVPATPGIDRIANVIGMQASIRAREKHARNPHTLERHGPYVADEVLQNWDLGDSEPPARFVTIGEMFSCILEAAHALHRAQIEQNCADKMLGLVEFTGPTVAYEAWSPTGLVKGSAPTVFRIWFDGEGHWGLETAFPKP